MGMGWGQEKDWGYEWGEDGGSDGEEDKGPGWG